MVKKFYEVETELEKLFRGKVKSFFWYCLKMFLNLFAPLYYRMTEIPKAKSSKAFVNEEVIISLTSFPKRMKTLPLTLESLFRQTVKPTKIILWLAE